MSTVSRDCPPCGAIGTVALRSAIGCIGFLLLLGVVSPAVASTSSPGDLICADCHEEVVLGFALGPHARASGGDADNLAACASCHGDATAHVDEGAPMFSFAAEGFADAKSDTCLSCHGTDHAGFDLSQHAAAGLDCTSCHSVHNAEGDRWNMLAVPAFGTPGAEIEGSASCAECHSEVFAQFEFNESHRLQEGIVDCTSCHDPHEPSVRSLLGGFKHEACASCHTDKAGPFVFEHGAGRVEGCSSCHSAHGSPNRHMLAFQSTGELCYSCHAFVPGFHSRFTLESNCTNCHSTIHGSNFDPFFLK